MYSQTPWNRQWMLRLYATELVAACLVMAVLIITMWISWNRATFTAWSNFTITFATSLNAATNIFVIVSGRKIVLLAIAIANAFWTLIWTCNLIWLLMSWQFVQYYLLEADICPSDPEGEDYGTCIAMKVQYVAVPFLIVALIISATTTVLAIRATHRQRKGMVAVPPGHALRRMSLRCCFIRRQDYIHRSQLDHELLEATKGP